MITPNELSRSSITPGAAAPEPLSYSTDDALRSVDIGWHPMIRDVFKLVEAGEGVVVQVKEKFGGLRIYTSTATQSLLDTIRVAELHASTVCQECGHLGLSQASYRTSCLLHVPPRSRFGDLTTDGSKRALIPSRTMPHYAAEGKEILHHAGAEKEVAREEYIPSASEIEAAEAGLQQYETTRGEATDRLWANSIRKLLSESGLPAHHRRRWIRRLWEASSSDHIADTWSHACSSQVTSIADLIPFCRRRMPETWALSICLGLPIASWIVLQPDLPLLTRVAWAHDIVDRLFDVPDVLLTDPSSYVRQICAASSRLTITQLTRLLNDVSLNVQDLARLHPRAIDAGWDPNDSKQPLQQRLLVLIRPELRVGHVLAIWSLLGKYTESQAAPAHGHLGVPQSDPAEFDADEVTWLIPILTWAQFYSLDVKTDTALVRSIVEKWLHGTEDTMNWALRVMAASPVPLGIATESMTRALRQALLSDIADKRECAVRAVGAERRTLNASPVKL